MHSAQRLSLRCAEAPPTLPEVCHADHDDLPPGTVLWTGSMIMSVTYSTTP